MVDSQCVQDAAPHNTKSVDSPSDAVCVTAKSSNAEGMAAVNPSLATSDTPQRIVGDKRAYCDIHDVNDTGERNVDVRKPANTSSNGRLDNTNSSSGSSSGSSSNSSSLCYDHHFSALQGLLRKNRHRYVVFLC